jgi:hypothetical protein
MKNFIICLSKIESSLNTATKLKNQLEGYGADVELFEGTYGTDAKRMMDEEGRTLHPWGIKGPPKDGIIPEPDPTLHWGPGIQGCFYSHYRLWQKCVELNEPITIWEDDIVLSRPYQPVEWTDVLVLALGHPGKTDKYRIHRRGQHMNQDQTPTKPQKEARDGNKSSRVREPRKFRRIKVGDKDPQTGSQPTNEQAPQKEDIANQIVI